jgi:hypothetical protein
MGEKTFNKFKAPPPASSSSTLDAAASIGWQGFFEAVLTNVRRAADRAIGRGAT